MSERDAAGASYPPGYWERLRETATSGPGPAEWPKDIRAISQGGLALLGIDQENRLHWDGRRIPTVTLTRWQKAGAVVVTCSAAIGALAAVASAAADWKTAMGEPTAQVTPTSKATVPPAPL